MSTKTAVQFDDLEDGDEYLLFLHHLPQPLPVRYHGYNKLRRRYLFVRHDVPSRIFVDPKYVERIERA